MGIRLDQVRKYLDQTEDMISNLRSEISTLRSDLDEMKAKGKTIQNNESYQMPLCDTCECDDLLLARQHGVYFLTCTKCRDEKPLKDLKTWE